MAAGGWASWLSFQAALAKPALRRVLRKAEAPHGPPFLQCSARPCLMKARQVPKPPREPAVDSAGPARGGAAKGGRLFAGQP